MQIINCTRIYQENKRVFFKNQRIATEQDILKYMNILGDELKKMIVFGESNDEIEKYLKILEAQLIEPKLVYWVREKNQKIKLYFLIYNSDRNSNIIENTNYFLGGVFEEIKN